MKKIVFAIISYPFFLFSCGGDTTTSGVTEKDTVVTSTITDSAATTPPAVQSYLEKLSYESVAFSIQSPQLSENNTVVIVPSGLSIVNDSIPITVEGKVSKSSIADIDGDNALELLIVTKDANNKGYAYVFSSNKNKSVSQVHIAEDETKKDAFNGYNGEDDYELVESVMVRTFPLFNNGSKTGKTRQIQYKLKPGEAMKQLKIDKVFDF